jgi:translocation protein SEC62
VYQFFAEKVRDNKQLPSRWAIMQETRVEYFRGKDFTVFMKNHPELRDILGTDKDLDVDEIVNTLLRKHLLIRCDRLVKTLRPGKKKLSSWPAHLEIHMVSIIMCKLVLFACVFCLGSVPQSRGRERGKKE